MAETVIPRLTLSEAASVLVKHYNLHEGLWAVAFDLRLGVGQFGPTPDEAFPGAMFGITNIYLTPAEKDGPFIVDAAKVNPGVTAPPKKNRAK